MADDALVPRIDARPRFYQSMIWRASCWAVAAFTSVCIASLAATSEGGAQRLAMAVDSLVSKPAPVVVAQIPAKPQEPSQESVKLSEALRLLAADRERLDQRMVSLERSLDDVTGSIKRQVADIGARTAAVTPPPAAQPAAPQPAISAPATVAVTAPPVAAPQPAAQPAAPQEYVPLPPERVASVEPPAEAAAPLKPDVGIDLGGAPTPEALRAHWSSIKANYGPMLGPLQPLIVARERKNAPTSYRLILGPLPSATAATHVCAQLIAARASCRPASYISQNASQL